MKPREILAGSTVGGGRLVLERHDGEHFLRLDGRLLMSTQATASEEELARVVMERLRGMEAPRLLVGGLGFGATLRAVLRLAGVKARVVVVELLADVVSWNRDVLGGVHREMLEDPRVTVVVGDLRDVLGRVAGPEGEGGDPEGAGEAGGDEPGVFDGMMLDVDNGAAGMVLESNAALYGPPGLGRIREALREGGVAAFWSAGRDPGFRGRLQRAGFGVEAISAKAHATAKRFSHTIYLGTARPFSPFSPGSQNRMTTQRNRRQRVQKPRVRFR